MLGHVTRNLGERVSPEVREQFELIPLVDEMVKRGWTGEKAGQGFYKRIKGAGGKSEILALDLKTLEYRPQQKAKFPSIEAGKNVEDVGARIRSIFLADDKAGALLRATLGPTLLYAAKVALDIAHSIDDVDRAMQWGFGWELGPFATWDAIGVKEVLAACPGADVPPLVQQVLDRGANRFRDGGVPPQAPELALLATAKASRGVVKKNAGASLVDLGDGVLCLEFHSKMNAIGGDTLAMIDAGVKEAEANHQALVVGNDSTNFSVGANLMLLLLEAQEGNWDDLEMMIRAFQKGTMTLKYAGVPVVVAPAGLALGGGCEVTLHGARVQAAAETYLGLVEVGVGLIPAGGGTKEMTARAVEHVTSLTTDLLPLVQPVFEALAFGSVATSAEHARAMGFLRPGDRISMNRDRIIADAKDLALTLARGGYQAPIVRSRDRGRWRGGARVAQARRPHGVARRAHQRSRQAGGYQAGDDHRGRRAAAPGVHHRAATAGSRARGVPQPVRRAQDARAHPAHAQDGQAAAELSPPAQITPGVICAAVNHSGSVLQEIQRA